MLVEHAIFTSAHTDRGDGYQLVATSPGLVSDDADALRVWCPSHGALLDRGPATGSVNFHPLPSGAWCVAHTSLAGMEFSQRGGECVHTHCLVVPPEVLERFANNPFAVLRAAVAGGVLDRAESTGKTVPAFQMIGRASAVDRQALEPVAAALGQERMARLLAAALTVPTLGLAGMVSVEALVAAIMNSLPVECRTQYSFSTGLTHSPRRPFRLMALPSDSMDRAHLARQFGLTLLDLADEQNLLAPGSSTHPWAEYVAELLASGQIAALTAHLMRPRPGLTLADLTDPNLPPVEPQDENADRRVRRPAASHLPSLAHAHLPHQRFSQSVSATAVAPRPAGPSQSIPHDAANVALLEELDDAVYDAIALKVGALKQLAALWPQVLSQLDPQLVEDSRERYLAYAITVWKGFVSDNSDPERAIAALDVIDVLGG